MKKLDSGNQLLLSAESETQGRIRQLNWGLKYKHVVSFESFQRLLYYLQSSRYLSTKNRPKEDLSLTSIYQISEFELRTIIGLFSLMIVTPIPPILKENKEIYA